MSAQRTLLNLPIFFVAVVISLSARSAELHPGQEISVQISPGALVTTLKTKNFNSIPISGECTSGIVPRSPTTYQYVDALLSTIDLEDDPNRRQTILNGRNKMIQAAYLLKIMLYKYQGESPEIADLKLKTRVDEFNFVLPTDYPVSQIDPEVYENLAREHYSNLFIALTNDIDAEVRRLKSVGIYSREIQRLNSAWLRTFIAQKKLSPQNLGSLSPADLAELKDRQQKFEVARCTSIRSDILANDLKARRHLN